MAFIISIVSFFLMTTSVLALNPRQAMITAAPSVTTAVCTDKLHYVFANNKKYFCPGVVDGINGTDVTNAYCCIDAIYEVGIPSTSWYYNYTMTSIPSTVITPTTCVQPIPLTASDYESQASAASPTPTWSASFALGSDGSSISTATATATAATVTKYGNATYTGPVFTGGAGRTTSAPLVGVLMAVGVLLAAAAL